MSQTTPPVPSTTIRVLLVDDHPVVRDGLASLLGAQPGFAVVAQAGSGEEAVAQFRAHRPDVTLMDLRMPRMGGVEAIRAIRKDHPEARFVVLTTYDGDEEIFQAVQAGAQAYLLKDMFGPEILETVRTVHAGKKLIPRHIAERLADRITQPALSPREVEILQLVAKGESNKGIAAALGLSDATVKTHVAHILEKLGVADRTAATTVALQRGIIRL